MSKNEFDKSIPPLMKGLVKDKAEPGFEYVNNLKVPEPGPGEVLVKSYRVGICGSDLILHDWTKAASLIATVPFTPGHEASGVVVKIGEKTGLKVGQRVAIENHFFCGKCYQCLNGRKDICSNLNQFGHGKGTKQGGCSEYFKVRAEYCYRLRKRDTTWRNGALLEPLGVAVNACETANISECIKTQETVLVIGAGTIGCLAVAVCKAYKVSKVICIDVVDWKLEIAKKYGASIVNVQKEFGNSIEDRINYFLKETNGVGIGKIIECSGHSDTISNMFKYLRKGGTAVLVGLPKEPLEFIDPMPDIVFKSLTIKTIHGRRIYDTWKRAEELVSKRLINLDYVVTDEIPLSQFKEGYDRLKSGKAMKVIFDCTK